MARAAKKDEFEDNGDVNGEYVRPDAAKAFEIYDKQIKPKLAVIAEKKGDLSQPYDDIKEHAHFPRKILDLIVFLEGQEDAKRDHLLLALSEGLKHRQIFMPRDLVTMAAGEDEGDVIPTGERKRPFLAAIDGAAARDAEDFDEADEEELAAQSGRPSNEADDDDPEDDAD
jgi:hypothetical protein